MEIVSPNFSEIGLLNVWKGIYSFRSLVGTGATNLMSTFYSIHSSWWFFFWVAIEMHSAAWNQKSSIVIRLPMPWINDLCSFLLMKKKKNTTLCWKICIVDKSCLSPNIILWNQNCRSIKTSIWWFWH